MGKSELRNVEQTHNEAQASGHKHGEFEIFVAGFSEAAVFFLTDLQLERLSTPDAWENVFVRLATREERVGN